MEQDRSQDQIRRKPRACKRGRPSHNELRGAKTSGRGRAECYAELTEELDNRRYASEPVPNVTVSVRPTGRGRAELTKHQENRRYASEPVPNVSVHYSNTGPITSTMQQPPIYYRRTPEKQAEAANNQPQARYPTQQEQPQTYSRASQNISPRNPTVAQILYPNMMQVPPPVTQYSVPDEYPVHNQITQADTAPEQATTGYRYNTRKGVHNLNLPLNTVHNMTNYSTQNSNPTTSNEVPKTQKLPKTVQTRQSTQKKLATETTSSCCQTDLTLTDDEVKFIKTVRSKRMNISQLTCMIDNNNYVVTYNDEGRIQTVDTLRKSSQDMKMSMLAHFYAMACQALTPSANPAIPYQEEDNDDERVNGLPSDLHSSPLLENLLAAPVQSADGANDISITESESATLPPQPQVPQQRAHPNWHMPTVLDQRHTRRYQPFWHPARPRPPFNPYLLQNIQNNPRMHMDGFQNYPHMHANFDPQMHAPERYGTPGWF